MASAIVFIAGLIAGAYWNREELAIKIKSLYVHVPPKAVDAHASGTAESNAFRGRAPWALSALPECFMQIAQARSPHSLAFVRAHLPHGAKPVSAPATLHYADCTLQIAKATITVERGADRLYVPARAQLYIAGNILALLRTSRKGYDLRIYHIVPESAAR